MTYDENLEMDAAFPTRLRDSLQQLCYTYTSGLLVSLYMHSSTSAVLTGRPA